MADSHPGSPSYQSVNCTDAVELTRQIGNWTFEFNQLTPGNLKAVGSIFDFAGVSVGRVVMNRTMLHRGYAPRSMFAVFVPGEGSGHVYAHAQLLERGHCVTLSEGACLEAVSHGTFMDVALGFDLSACATRIESLSGAALGAGSSTTVAAPGETWTRRVLERVEWILAAAANYPHCLANAHRLESLADQLLAAVATMSAGPTDADLGTRSTRANRRIAVRVARDLIHSKLSEPLRLSELCKHARLKIRSLEYGFKEVTGLTPVAYIRSLRLNAARRALQHEGSAPRRTISEIAMDAGFWHLGQFAADYKLLFGETPSQTRRRLARP
jgi:AraC family ethanolamine operon transcriptional activator